MSKIPKATHNGTLEINGIKIMCAVLEDETRVISERSLALAMGVRGSGAYWQKRKKQISEVPVPEYISANYLQPFVGEALKEKLSKSITYMSKGKNARGFEATVLPDVCDVWIKAGEDSNFPKSQTSISKNAYILLKGFANIGIIALIDEATGYQYVRDKKALHKILEAYVSKELLPWSKRFPDEFYKELFRLNNWSYNPISVKRPSVIGKWTNTIIYDRLPKGVLEELKAKTPKSEAGNYTAKFFQSLTNDIGNPHLEKQILMVIPVMRLSQNMRKFWSNFAKAFSVGQQELDLDED